MKIYFVRHGHPDYKHDCLTELGHSQAEAAAERLENCGIEQLFSSTRGRALQTAEHTAKRLGLEIIKCEFIREMNWAAFEGETIPFNGHPWNVSDLRVSEGESLLCTDWQTKEPYCRSNVVERSRLVAEGLDKWLCELGYTREGEYYRVTGENTDRAVAMFSHAGSSSAALAHMFNIPFPQFVAAFHLDFTSVTLVELPCEKGRLVYPKFIFVDDARHIEGLSSETFFGN